MRLFSELAERNLFSTYAAALDWILSDHKFSVNLWDNKNKVQAFTKAFHRMEGVSQGRVHYEPKGGPHSHDSVNIDSISCLRSISLGAIPKREI